MAILFLIIIALIPSLFWLLFYLLKDYREPEPRKLLLKIFVWGTIVAIPVTLAISWLVSMYEGPSPESIGQYLWYFLITAIVYAAIEEWVKYWIAKSVVNRNKKYFTQIVDGIIYLATAAAAFAFVENLKYFLEARSVAAASGFSSAFTWYEVLHTLGLRSIGATVMHLAASGLLGYFWGISWFKKNEEEGIRPLLIGFGAAIALHGFFNFSIYAQIFTNFELGFVPLILALIGSIYLFFRFRFAENTQVHAQPGAESEIVERPKTTTLLVVVVSALVILAIAISVFGVRSRLSQTSFFYSVVSFAWQTEDGGAIHPVIVTRAESSEQCETLKNLDTESYSEIFEEVEGACDGSLETNELFATAFNNEPITAIYLSYLDDWRGNETRVVLLDDFHQANEEAYLLGIKEELESGGITDIAVIYPPDFCRSGCWFGDSCVEQPANSHCVQDQPNRAWQCDEGLNESGGYCVSCSSAACNREFPGSKFTTYDPGTNKCTCDCPSGSSWNAAGTACVSDTAGGSSGDADAGTDIDTACKRKYGPSYYDGSYCECLSEYVWNNANTACISRSDSCVETWPNSYWNGQYSAEGKFLCECKPGYQWNSSQTACQ